VLGHYALVLGAGRSLPPDAHGALESARANVAEFSAAISAAPRRLDEYVEQLNRTPPQFVWWWCVAHPELEDTWKN
jgi:hypothetical protein